MRTVTATAAAFAAEAKKAVTGVGAGDEQARVLRTDHVRARRAHGHVFVVVAEVAIRVGEHRADRLPVNLQLFRNHHRHRRQGALALLGVRNADGDDAFGVDRQPLADLNAVLVGRVEPRLLVDRGRVGEAAEADRHAAAGKGRRDDERAAGNFHMSHCSLP